MNTYLWVKDMEILDHQKIVPGDKTVFGYWAFVEGLVCVTSYN